MNKKKSVRKYFKSLKFRLICLFILFGVLAGAAVRFGIVKAYEQKAISRKTIEISNYAKILADEIVDTDYVYKGYPNTITAQLQQMSWLCDGRIMVIDDSFRIVTDTYSLNSNKTIISEEVVKCFQNKETSRYDEKNGYIEMTLPLKTEPSAGENPKVVGVMLISASTDSITADLAYIRESAGIVQLAVAMILFGIGVFLAMRLTNPLKKMASSIEDIHNGYGDSTGGLMIADYTETIKISEKFNKLYSRMKLLDDSRQEFVSNVSHELKTPLTSMKVLADSLNGQDNVPVELYREFMLDIGNEIERENKIINDLLSLVKMDKSASDLNIATVNMNEMLALLMKRLNPIAEQAHVELVLESFRPVTAEIDEVKLTLAFSNLIENAIKYNREDGWVHVSLNADYQYFYLKVEDSGMGIPEESLEHIYERFYRVDKSHSREIGGTGLGLAITRNVILMHRGAIKVFSTEGEGTLFTVRIPLNYIV